MKPKVYQRKPTTIVAMQWDGENYQQLRDWGAPVTFIGNPIPIGDESYSPIQYTMSLWVEANKSYLPIEIGEWVAKDQFGYYPIKDDGGAPVNYHEVLDA